LEIPWEEALPTWFVTLSLPLEGKVGNERSDIVRMRCGYEAICTYTSSVNLTIDSFSSRRSLLET